MLRYCYHVLGIDFPERGFLLFGQLSLLDKLQYFEIEDELIDLTRILEKSERKKAVEKKLVFLRSNPIEKVNNAFKARFKADLNAYFGI